MTWNVPPDRYAVELILAGMMGALVKSKAVKVGMLEDHVLVPLLKHMQMYDAEKDKAGNEIEKTRAREIAFECMTWHAYMENVFNSLK
jgi:hypothetical protein